MSDFRRRLQKELVDRCGEDKGYSLRKFAHTLKMDASTLSKILRGERKIGKKLIENIGKKIGLEDAELALYLSQEETGVGAEYNGVSLDTFKIISDWYHFAILELIRLDHFESDPAWVAKCLGITAKEAEQAVERLKRLNFLAEDKHGKWLDASDGRTTTTTNPHSVEAFRNMQRQLLLKAIDAMEKTEISQRDQSSMTMAIDSKMIPVAKEKIKNFRRDLAKTLSRGKSRDRVYSLTIGMFPLSANEGLGL